MRHVASWILFVSAVALPAQSSLRDNALPQQANSGTIRGRVIAADGGEPLRNARVTISGPSSVPRIFTDGDGRFLFSNLTFGRYALLVRKAGYVQTPFGPRKPADPPMWIEITAESPAFSAEVRLPRSAAISGRILDDLGNPIELAQVSAERVIRTDGRVGAMTMAITITDDLGEYRLGGLPEGRFVVSARRSANNEVRFTVVDGRTVAERPDGTPSRGYYPGVATLSEAQPITDPLERDLDGARISRSALHRPQDLDGTAAGAVSLGHGVIRSRVVPTNQRRPGGREIVVTRERFRSADQLNQACSRFTVHRRARTLGVERVLTPRRGHTDQVPPSFCRPTRPSQAPVQVHARPRRSEQAPISWREH
jgi:hypothetical protein